jgi:hypothetical protein
MITSHKNTVVNELDDFLLFLDERRDDFFFLRAALRVTVFRVTFVRAPFDRAGFRADARLDFFATFLRVAFFAGLREDFLVDFVVFRTGFFARDLFFFAITLPPM